MKIELKKVTTGRAVGQQYLLIDGKHQVQVKYIELHNLGLSECFFAFNGDNYKGQIYDTLYEALLHIGIPLEKIDDYINILPKGWTEERWLFP